MQNRRVWFVRVRPGSEPVSGVGDGVPPSRTFLAVCQRLRSTFLGETLSAGHRKSERNLSPHARYPIRLVALLILAPLVCFGQEASPTPTPSEMEAEPIVVTATRFDIPLDLSPASVSVINSEDFEQKQIQRISDALREVPGLSVVQTGTAGQLTSVFTRGLRSEHTQVLLDGIPINQGLSGAFNFAELTVDDIDRIEVVRGPQSTLYGPRALAGVIQIFTKQGTGTPGAMVAAEGGSYDAFREWGQSDGKIGNFDYSSAQAASTQTTRARTTTTATLLRLPTWLVA